MYPNEMTRRFSSFLDRSALTLSGLCLVHCLAGSLLLTVFAVSGDWLGHNIHFVGLLLALPLAAVALWRGVRLHGRIGVALLGMVGIALMALSLLVSHGDMAEVVVSVIGVSLLAVAHLWNLRASRAAS
jgi:MerC mercury resistance protein